MNIKSSLVKLALIILVFGCNDNQGAKNATNQNESSFTNIEIHLHPAFNNSSIIKIDRVSRMVYYNVDTAMKWIKEKPETFTCRLDSFERNTLVESFYLQNFQDSIREKPDNWVLDGLSIFTVVNRENTSDTIMSGNVYPTILDENVVSQIDYISRKTSDSALINYLKDLRGYFHFD